MGQRSVPLDQITEYVKGLANENLLKATDKTANLTASLKRPSSNYVDMDTMLDIIYKLFQEEGYIMEKDDDIIESVDNVGPLSVQVKPFTKFKLIENYPEFRGQESIKYFPIVSYQIPKRTIQSMKQDDHVPHGSARRPARPMIRHTDVRNFETGDQETLESIFFDNTLEFISWQVSSRESRQIAKLIEDFFLFKANEKLRQKCRNLVFLARGRQIYTDDYGPKRMFGTPIQLLVQTEESMLIQEQTINEISVTTQPI